MSDFLASPWVAVMLVSILAIEAVALLLIWKLKEVGLPPLSVISFLGAGFAFALALGFALSNKSAIGIGASLTLAFVFHLTDLLLRWQKQS